MHNKPLRVSFDGCKIHFDPCFVLQLMGEDRSFSKLMQLHPLTNPNDTPERIQFCPCRFFSSGPMYTDCLQVSSQRTHEQRKRADTTRREAHESRHGSTQQGRHERSRETQHNTPGKEHSSTRRNGGHARPEEKKKRKGYRCETTRKCKWSANQGASGVQTLVPVEPRALRWICLKNA